MVAGAKGLQALGTETGRHLVVYGLAQPWRERRERHVERRAQRGWVLPGWLQGWHQSRSGATLSFPEAELEVSYLASDVVRLTWSPGSAPVPYALSEQVPAWERPQVACDEGDAGLTLEASKGSSSAAKQPSSDGSGECELAVRVSRDGQVVLADGSGGVLLHQLPPVRRGAGWTYRSRLAPGEALYGLGEQAGSFNLREPAARRRHRHISPSRSQSVSGAQVYRLWNRDAGGTYGPGLTPLYLGIPVMVGRHGAGSYLVFFENSFRGSVKVPHEGATEATLEASFSGGQLRLYVIGGSVAHALQRYGELTGMAPLPPRWALGYHQSRWGYRTADQVREVVRRFVEMGAPLDAIHLDLDYMDGYRVFTIDGKRFGDMAALSSELGKSDVHLVTIIDPGVKVDNGYSVYDTGMAEGRFCRLPDGRLAVGAAWPGPVAFPDFTDAGARAWWGANYQVLVDAGVSGVWHDMNEPSMTIPLGDRTLPLDTVHGLEGRGGDHREAHNYYGLLMDRAGFAALTERAPDKRPFILSRSGWAGIQRYAWSWTGDTESSWAALAQTVPTLLGLGMSGMPYSGPDVGGFMGEPDPELYLRWLQLAVFLPFCRTHSVIGARPREPWTFEEPFRHLIVSALRFRRSIRPYLYTLAEECARTGAPLVRPLWWPGEHPRSPGKASLDVDDAFLLGDSLLVAPATRPGMRVREVSLPSGAWHRLSWPNDPLLSGREGGKGGKGGEGREGREGREGGKGGESGKGVEAAVIGPRTVLADMPMECLAVFVRAGSILPVEVAGHLELLAFRDASGGAAGTLYRDSGDGYGPWRRDRVTVQPGRTSSSGEAGEPGATKADSGTGALHAVWEGEGDLVAYPEDAPVRTVSVSGS